MDKRQRLFEILNERSFRRGDFVLASGKRSTYYIDCKPTALSPEGMVLIGQLLYECYLQAGLKVAAVAGPSIGADPITIAVCHAAWAAGEPLFGLMVRKQPKDHGTGKRVEGASNLAPGSAVLLVEDVVTTGGSSLDTVQALTAAGFRVVQAMALVDRQEGGPARFAEAGVPFQALFSIREFLEA